MWRLIAMVTCLFAVPGRRLVFATCLLSTVCVQADESPLEKYRNLEFPAEPAEIETGFQIFDDGWQDRVSLEFEIVNTADLKSLRAGLNDKNHLVRSMAARALGIRGDKASAEALAELVKSDPTYHVRIRAVESLGLLKLKPEVIELARTDKHNGVSWAADLAKDQLESEQDLAGQMRRAFAVGITHKEMGIAKVGQPAPDFTAHTLDGKPFQLSSVLGRQPIAIYFAAFDQ